MFIFVTEHPAGSLGYDLYPISAEACELFPGQIFSPCEEFPTSFVIRGVFDTYEEAKVAMNSINDENWDDWLSKWKAQHA